MSVDFKSMSQEKKIKLGLLAGMVVSYFLPWFGFQGETLSALSLYVLTKYYPIVIGLIAAAVGFYLVLVDKQKYNIYISVSCVFSALNFYFIIIPYDNPMWNGSLKSEYQKLISSGFYGFALLSGVFLFIVLREMGIIDKLTKKAESSAPPLANKSKTPPLQADVKAPIKPKKPAVKVNISRKTKTLAVVVILIAAAGGGYYKFIYTPKYEAYDFITKFLVELADLADKADHLGSGEKRKVGNQVRSKIISNNPRMIFNSMYVYKIERVKKEESSAYSASDYNKQMPVFKIHVHPFKKLGDGKIAVITDYDQDLPQPADLFDKEFQFSVIINVYDSTILNSYKLLPSVELVVSDFEEIYYRNENGYSSLKDRMFGYYLSSISAKLKFSEIFFTDEGLEFDLIEIIEANNVSSPLKKEIEKDYEVNYNALTNRNTGFCKIYFSINTKDSTRYVVQKRPIIDTILTIDGSGYIEKKYIGETMYKEPEGKGTLVTYYEGKFNDGKESMDMIDAVYKGEFKFGLPHGQGTKTWTTGSKYTGNFVAGLMDGKGVYFGADSSKYEGQFKKGSFSGEGIKTYNNGVSYNGSWLEGKWNGRGTLKYADGGEYQGIFDMGTRTSGILTWPSGEKYEGEFINNEPGGKGILYAADGSVQWQH